MEDMMEKLSRMVVKVSVALAVATCLLSGTANAQPLLKGTFTLPYDVRWGGTLVPAGQYQIVIDSARRPALVSTLSGTGLVFATPQVVNDASRGEKTALIVTMGETERTVRALNWREGNRSFVYKPFTKAERQSLAQARTETVAIRTAQN
jgi:hypothetical protein